MTRIAPPFIPGTIVTICTTYAWLIIGIATGFIDMMPLPAFLLVMAVIAFATAYAVNVFAGRLEIEPARYDELARARKEDAQTARLIDEIGATGTVTVNGFNKVVAMAERRRLVTARNGALRESGSAPIVEAARTEATDPASSSPETPDTGEPVQP